LEARDAAMLRSNDLAGKRAQARQILEQFNAQGGQDSGASRSTQDRQAPAPMPARVKAYVDQFVDANPWFKAGDARDLDSRVVTMIDDQVKADGYNEGTQDYWDELSDRLRAAPQLAHRFRESGRDAGGQGRAVVPPQQRGPQMAPAVNRQPRAGASDNQVYLTPERKAALIQVGALAADGRTVANPAKFQRVLKSYQEFDRDQTGSRA
jgi:hypothetical protein